MGQVTAFKTVRVTAAVYQGFTRLNPSLTHWHWADLRKYTQRFRLALPYVFQSKDGLKQFVDKAIHRLLNSRALLVTATYWPRLSLDSRHGLFRRYAANLPNSLD